MTEKMYYACFFILGVCLTIGGALELVEYMIKCYEREAVANGAGEWKVANDGSVTFTWKGVTK